MSSGQTQAPGGAHWAFPWPSSLRLQDASSLVVDSSLSVCTTALPSYMVRLAWPMRRETEDLGSLMAPWTRCHLWRPPHFLVPRPSLSSPDLTLVSPGRILQLAPHLHGFELSLQAIPALALLGVTH